MMETDVHVLDKSSFLNYSIKDANTFIVSVITIAMLAGFPIQVISGTKIHYAAFILGCFILLLINMVAVINYLKLVYFSVFALPILYFLSSSGIDNAFVFSLVPYVIVPIVFWNKAFVAFKLASVLKIFQFFTVIYFIGVLLQMVGVSAPFLAMDITKTEGIVHERYGSFAGGTLALGLTASVSFIFTYYQWVYEKRKGLVPLLLLLISFFTLLFAQSRRFYILIFAVALLIYLYNRPARPGSIKKVLSYVTIVVVMLIFLVLYLFKDSNYYLQRIFSVADFAEDESNLLRVAKWLQAIQAFLRHFWFGMGLGASGTIGKNFDPMVTSVDDILVAESYYLKILLECGVVFGTGYLIFQVFLLTKIFRSFRMPRVAFPAFLLFFFFLESFMSTSLESALPSMLFWISVSKLLMQDTQL